MKRRSFIQGLNVGAGAMALSTLGGAMKIARFAARPPSTAESTPIPSSSSRDPYIEVDFWAIGRNLKRKRQQAKVPVLGVVKANAYGHGLVKVGRHLESVGAAALITGKLAKAMTLRLAGIRCPVVNAGPVSVKDCEEIVRQEVRQFVSASEMLDALDAAAAKCGKTADIDVHIDTGMNRSGVPAEEALPFTEHTASLRHIRIAGISSTRVEDPEYDQEQLRNFNKICLAAKDRGIGLGLRHIASSDALYHVNDTFLDMVRPGITLYGYYPNAKMREENIFGLEPALRFKAFVTFIRDVKPGQSLSYDCAIRIDRPMRVATVGVGYSDGYPPLLGEKALS